MDIFDVIFFFIFFFIIAAIDIRTKFPIFDKLYFLKQSLLLKTTISQPCARDKINLSFLFLSGLFFVSFQLKDVSSFNCHTDAFSSDFRNLITCVCVSSLQRKAFRVPITGPLLSLLPIARHNDFLLLILQFVCFILIV